MKAVAAVLALALVALGILGGRLWTDLRQERDSNRELAAGMPAQPGTSPGATAAVQPAQASGAAPGIASASASGSPAAAPPQQTLMQSTQEMLATPAGQDFQRAMLRRMLAQQYPDIEAEMGMSPAEAEALLDLLARHQAAAAPGQMEVLNAGGDPAARQEMFSKINALERANREELAQLLGPKLEQWQKYERTVSTRRREDMERQLSQQLRAAVSSDRNPLTDAQFQSLSAALQAEERLIDRQSGNQSMQQQMDGLDERVRRMSAVAADHLNAEQLAQYQAHLQQQMESVRAMMGMVNAAENAAPPPASPRN